MIQAVLFDLGDTLLDFEPMDTRALFFQAARATYDHLATVTPALPPFDAYARGHYRAVRWAYLWAKLRRREFSSFALLRQFHQRHGLPADDRTLRDVAWLWYHPVVAHSTAEPGLADTLAAMRAAGLRLGVLSNTFVPPFVHDRHLDDLGLLAHLDVRVYSSEVGYRKPDRRIFRIAADRLGVAPRHTLFVGDLVKTDVVGARRAGMKTVLKQPYSNPGRHRVADYVVRRIADLATILPQLNVPASSTHPSTPSPTPPPAAAGSAPAPSTNRPAAHPV